MLKLTDFDKVLVTYLYEPDKKVPIIVNTPAGPVARIETIKGKKRGVVVALGAGILGWSLCNINPGWSPKKGYHPADIFDKEKGLDLALKRANIASSLTFSERENFYSKVPFSLLERFEHMSLRSERYFRPDSSEDDLPF